ncbi:MAG TPA: 1-deoxy-D-xylulose-5-phosphate reductoisomerase [Burkholderiales bacterium]
MDVVARHPGRFQVFALTARNHAERLAEQCLRFRPRYAVLLDEGAARELRRRLGAADATTEVLAGAAALDQVAADPDVDMVMAAIVGAAGLRPTLAAARAGKRVLLANKEPLVMAGRVFMDAVSRHGAELLPIDSEHNAIFQVLPAARRGGLAGAGVRRILLTASGGPFRTATPEALEAATPEQACAHPNWSMGRKISVDSATLMNKGLEVIEAHWLFGARAEQIRVVVHPQSIVHSLVEYVDGSVLAQLGNPDMRTPIAHAMAYPERIEAGVESLDLVRVGGLQFEEPDLERFPCLTLAYDALHRGGAAPAMLNAANEAAVAAFLDGRMPFTAIPEMIRHVLGALEPGRGDTLEEVLEADRGARQAAAEWLECLV